jgi:hypothetical protein
MAENLDILNVAVSLVIKAALLAARFLGRVRKRSLKRLAALDADAKDRLPPPGRANTRRPHTPCPPCPTYHPFKEHALRISPRQGGPIAA